MSSALLVTEESDVSGYAIGIPVQLNVGALLLRGVAKLPAEALRESAPPSMVSHTPTLNFP